LLCSPGDTLASALPIIWDSQCMLPHLASTLYLCAETNIDMIFTDCWIYFLVSYPPPPSILGTELKASHLLPPLSHTSSLTYHLLWHVLTSFVQAQNPSPLPS
jgi:hypothetical protein